MTIRNLGFTLLMGLFGVLFPLKSNAWWDAGHMVTAQVAYDNLDKNARKKADGLIAILNKEYAFSNNFIAASTWPDDLKAEGVRFYNSWHYVNIPYNPDGVAIPPAPEVNVIWAIDNCLSLLKNTRRGRAAEQARALAFLIHFVGDLHQPLHSTTMYSHELPGGNRGGNSFNIDDSHRNLHKLWDDGCGYTTELNDINPYGEPKKALTNAAMERIQKFAKKLSKDWPQKNFPFVSQLDPKYWAVESHDLAVKYCYRGFNGKVDGRTQRLSPGGKPASEYLENGQKIVAQRLALGGYRLAMMLNEAWAAE